MLIDEKQYELMHYGTPRHSGRYPWGSGGNAKYSDSRTFLDHIKELLGLGFTEAQAAKAMGLESTTELRAYKTIATAEKIADETNRAQRLKDKGYSNTAIAEKMGIPESTVRSRLAPGSARKNDILQATSQLLRENVEEKKYVDVGVNVERQLNISKEKLATAVKMLEAEGYEVRTFRSPQVGTGHLTEYKVLCPPGTTQKEAWTHRHEVKQILEYSTDGGESYMAPSAPLSISSKRVAIRYAEDGGAEADGVLFVRPGVTDCSIGENRYAQVRVAVDGTHYIKGMAVYKDDLPDGVDILFNSIKSKHEVDSKLDALKPMQDKKGVIDEANPFGATIRRQIKNDKGEVTSAMNMVNWEGQWDGWNRAISTQVLSKQDVKVAKNQLDVLWDNKQREFEEIMSITNPVVKKKLLEEFADGTDSYAVHLQAAALPRQRNHVILPIKSLKDNEVYAPNYENGENVVLIRHPHGGKFEIPELVVNNRNREARRTIGTDAKDAIGINSKVAARLSGADFDGDTVIVIPNKRGHIKTSPALESLKNFDPIAAYPKYEGMKVMENKQAEMGKISNLITDMTILGASQDEIARAVRHSMVVIDAEKKELNYKQSYIDNGIASLNKKYRGKTTAGASTLISRARSQKRIPDRKLRPAGKGGPIDPVTGKKVWEETGKTWVNKETGKVNPKLNKVNLLAVTDDAYDLSSGTPIENVYAAHSNRLKDLANKARRETLSIKPNPYSPSAKKTYANEVASLNAKLNRALLNSPLERQAQLVANIRIRDTKREEPDMTPEDVKRLNGQAINEARRRVGAKKQLVDITEREWEAIQAGAISSSKLRDILNNASPEQVKKLATPREQKLMTSTKLTSARRLIKLGYTQAEIAAQLGVSVSTLKRSLGGSDD